MCANEPSESTTICAKESGGLHTAFLVQPLLLGVTSSWEILVKIHPGYTTYLGVGSDSCPAKGHLENSLGACVWDSYGGATHLNIFGSKIPIIGYGEGDLLGFKLDRAAGTLRLYKNKELVHTVTSVTLADDDVVLRPVAAIQAGQCVHLPAAVRVEGDAAMPVAEEAVASKEGGMEGEGGGGGAVRAAATAPPVPAVTCSGAGSPASSSSDDENGGSISSSDG